MASHQSFLKKLSTDNKAALLHHFGLPQPTPALDQGNSRSRGQKSSELDDALLKPPTEARDQVYAGLDRIMEMADEAGEIALLGLIQDRSVIDKLDGCQDRLTWSFLNAPQQFQRASEVRFTDDKRRGRTWDGFTIGPDLIPEFTDESRRHLTEQLESLMSGKVLIDCYTRVRTTYDGALKQVVQVTIYREGLPDTELAIEDGQVVPKVRRPVIEAALTYETESGVVEVVASGSDNRDSIAATVCQNLFPTAVINGKLPRRRFDLSVLTKPFAFPTDPADGIEAVQVRMVRLQPLDHSGERVVLEVGKRDRTIWAMAAAHFNPPAPLTGPWRITMARLAVTFQPETGSTRHKILPLTITMPHGCDLKDRSDREQLIAAKYLLQWGIVVEDPLIIEPK